MKKIARYIKTFLTHRLIIYIKKYPSKICVLNPLCMALYCTGIVLVLGS